MRMKKWLILNFLESPSPPCLYKKLEDSFCRQKRMGLRYLYKSYDLDIFSCFFYCCSSIVVSIFLPPCPPAPPTPTSHPQSYPPLASPCVFYTCSLMTFPFLSIVIPLPPHLWILMLLKTFWTFLLSVVILINQVPLYFFFLDKTN